MADETPDLDDLERLARSPEGDDGLDWSDDYKAATCPAAMLALIERCKVAEAAVRVFAKRWSEAVGMCDCCFALADCPDVELPDGYRCEVILCEWADAEARRALGLLEPEVPDGTD